MSFIIQPFVYSYNNGGIHTTKYFEVFDDLIPLKPIMQELGYTWHPDFYKRFLKLQGIHRLGIGNRASQLLVEPDTLQQILNSLQLGRCRYPEALKDFKYTLVPLLKAYFEEQRKLLERHICVRNDDLKPVFETNLREPAPINFAIPLSPEDICRRELPCVGIKPEEIAYLMASPLLTLCKPDPDNYGKPLKVSTYISNYKSHYLLDMAHKGFFPVPEYYRRFPQFYKRRFLKAPKLQWRNTRDDTALDPEAKWEDIPMGNAPWNTLEYETNIIKLQIIYNQAHDEAERKRLRKRLDSGEELMTDEEWQKLMLDFEELETDHEPEPMLDVIRLEVSEVIE